MEASALHAPAGLGRLPLASPLLRLRSDEQLVALFRAGSDDAFRVLHDRYRQRLFAYVRQMLSSHSRQDAEDVLQDVFVRAFGALRADARQMNVRAWLYRVAHNRCIDHLRRPVPPPAEIFEMSRKPLHDPVDEAQRRDDLRRLVSDVGRLPTQQRSALLMREIDGMSYADLAAALDVTVPAVKSLLVRARVGLVEAQEARDADCTDIRRDLHASYDRGVKASGRARRHMRECAGCREYRVALRSVRRSFAALVAPVGLGPLALAAKLLGAGGAGGGAAAAGTAGAGAGVGAGGGIVVGSAAACKVAAVVCATAITAGGAVEVKRLAQPDAAKERPRTAQKAQAPAVAAAAAAPVALAGAAPVSAVPAMRTRRPMLTAETAPKARTRRVAKRTGAVSADALPTVGLAAASTSTAVSTVESSGGIAAPASDAVAAPAADVPAAPIESPLAADGGAAAGGAAAPDATAPAAGTATGAEPAAESATTPVVPDDHVAGDDSPTGAARTGAVEAPPAPPVNGVNRRHWGPPVTADAPPAPADPAAVAAPPPAP